MRGSPGGGFYFWLAVELRHGHCGSRSESRLTVEVELCSGKTRTTCNGMVSRFQLPDLSILRISWPSQPEVPT